MKSIAENMPKFKFADLTDEERAELEKGPSAEEEHLKMIHDFAHSIFVTKRRQILDTNGLFMDIVAVTSKIPNSIRLRATELNSLITSIASSNHKAKVSIYPALLELVKAIQPQ